MEKQTNTPEDLVTTVLNVLHLTGWCYADIALRLAMKFHLTDLKGLVKVGGLNEVDLELLKSLDDPILSLIGESITNFEITIRSIADAYSITGEQMVADERIVEFAANFYYQTVIDGIPLTTEGVDMISYDDTLDLYALSLINVINWLCILLSTGEADLELSFDENHLYTEFMDLDYSHEEYAVALELLKQLGRHLHSQYFAIMEMH